MRCHLSWVGRLTRSAVLWALLACIWSAPAVLAQETKGITPTKEGQRTEPPAGVVYLPDLIYSGPSGKTPLMLDLAYPKEGDGPFPAIVCIHGGGWMKGSRKSNVPLIWELAQQGYVAVTISYRFAPAHPFPAQFHDAQCAVRWLRANAGKYKIDKDRIAALGHSSGGTLACLLGMPCAQASVGLRGEDSEPPGDVQAVVSFSGLTDLARLYECCRQGELPMFERTIVTVAIRSYLGGPPETACCAYLKASPITYASRNTAPTLLIHGTADRLVPVEQSRSLEKRLKAVGGQVRLLALQDAPHDFTGKAEQQANQAALEFLAKHLQSQPRKEK